MDLVNKKIVVVGAGVSGFAVAKIARKLGGNVVLCDSKNKEDIKYNLQELEDLGIEIVLGPQQVSTFAGADLVVLSPAVPRHLPLFEKVAETIPVIGEVEFAYRLAKAPILAITGTNGKTTTTMLLGELMSRVYPADKVGVGGNIGTPLCEEAMRIPEDGIIVAEISSYQMETAKDFKTHGAAVLNITPDHLARHKTMEVYAAEKTKIFLNQNENDFLVLNYEDDRTREMAKLAKGMVCFFSAKRSLEEGAYVEQGRLAIKWKGQEYRYCLIDELQIKGEHNVENALAALAMAFLAGGKTDALTEGLKKFAPVEHRIEPVATIGGVTYYNDSKATNPEASNKAIATFERSILIAGGDDKNTSLEEFYRLVNKHVSKLILIGDAAKRFKEEALKAGYPENNIIEAGYSMENAVKIAQRLAQKGEVVLLSPACASFDMYEGYEARGKDFKTIVLNLSDKGV